MSTTDLQTLEFAPRVGRLERTGWQVVESGSTLHKTFQFESFTEAFLWMTEVAFFAEQIDHHPTWANAFGIVDVSLTTFQTGTLTSKDMQMARKMDEAAGHV